MASTPRFYLKKSKSKNPLIILLFKWKGATVTMSTEENVPEEHWDKKMQRIPDAYCDLNPDYIEINKVLDGLAQFVTNLYNRHRRARKLFELTPEVMKRHIRAYRMGNEDGKLSTPVVTYYREWMDARLHDTSLKSSTTDSENVSCVLFERFAQTLPGAIYFENVTLRFFERYRDWFWQQSPPPSDATVHKHLRRFRQMCNHAAASGIKMGADVSAIKLASQLRLSPAAKETVALYDEELRVLQSLDLTDNPGLDVVRDLFLMGCYTGLRVNRWGEMRADNITEVDGKKYLEVITKKGRGKRVVIPLHPMITLIGNKYDWNFPKVPHEQMINRDIKVICERAGFTNNITQTKQVRGKSVQVVSPKYQLISTHTARRSFATNAYTAGMNLKDIMSLTAHSQEKTLRRYIREDLDKKAERIGDLPFFND